MQKIVLLAFVGILGCSSTAAAPASDGGAVDSSTADTGTSNPDAGSRVDSGSDAGLDSAVSFVDGSIPQGGSQPDPGSIKCGTATCTTGTSICCDPASSPETCASFTDTNSCPGGGRQECDETSDCTGGMLCCAVTAAGSFVETSCRSTCSTGVESPQVCKRNGECVNGKPCVAYTCADNKVWGLCDPQLQCH